MSHGGFDNRDAAAVWDCSDTDLSCVEGDSVLDDSAISLAVRKTVPAGGEVTFSFAYTLADVDVTTAALCTVPAVCGDGVIEGAETCDDGNAAAGDGCSAGCTEEPGYGCVGAPSVCTPVCGDSQIISPETCDDGNAAAGDGCSATCTTEPGSVCIGTPSVCGVCADTMSGDATDLGCSVMTPYCIGSGASAFCAPCDDDSATIDLGCADPTRVCDTSSAPVHVCVACEDSASGAGVDNGCVSARPFCGTTMSGAPTCVECVVDDDCGVGTVCSMTGACVPGCTDGLDCSGSTPVCDTTMRMCVECTDDTQCGDGQMCRPTRTCGAGDTDGDLVPDDVDDDDDNDGVPDVAEIDMSLVGDANGNGIPDYQDALRVTCPDTSPADGICDELPASVDLDGDGLPNHLDLDADGDGIADVREAGGDDTDGDGLVDGFMDGDGDGLHDPYLSSPLPTPSSDGDASPDFLDRDADGDGIPDTIEGGATDADADGVADDSADGNGDGIADGLTGAGAVPTPDTDGDGAADYQDVDADGDGIVDATEGTDADQDGEPDITPSGVDTDSDGLDDAFDPSCATAADCGGVIGAGRAS
ncbi:MAG: DUF4215 domain-containing protein [Sandaracinaceae bacterium]